MKTEDFSYKIRGGFSLVELLVVVVIIGILSTVSYVAIQGAKRKALNERMLDDLIMIANSLEDFRRDHDGSFPVPETQTENPDANQNVTCYYEDSTYAHDCGEAAFRQGMIDNDLLSKRYLRNVPTDPRTGSRYVYGVTNDGLFFQVAGNYEADDGVFEARLAGNLEKGFYLPSIIRAFDGSNFVVAKGTYLAYSDNHLVLTGKLENINGQVTVGLDDGVLNGHLVREGDIIETASGASADIYFSDGSFTHVDPSSKLELKSLRVERNDSKETTTKILLKLDLGKIWSKVVRLAKKSEFRVETTNSIAGVRGTEFGAEVDDDGNLKELILLAGEVDVDGRSFVVERTADKPRIPKKISFAASGEIEKEEEIKTPEAVAELVGDYYDDIELTSNMRPHILSIAAGEIIVRNANHFVNLVDDRTGFSRQIQVSRLAAYIVSDDGTIRPAPSYSEAIDLSARGTRIDPHVMTINRSSLPLRLKMVFEYVDGDDIKQSGFTETFDITGLTHLSQYDLYPRQFEERPVIKITAPRRYSYDSAGSSSNQFPVRATINDLTLNDGEEFVYGITAENSTGVCEPQQASSSLRTSAMTHDFRVDVSSEGECRLIVAALLPNGARLSKIVTIQIELPATDSGLVPVGGACGNGKLDGVEECDGEPNCDSNCTWQACGNGIRSVGADGEPEVCDDADLGGESCTSQGFIGGSLSCSSSCEFDTSGCAKEAAVAVCGNGTIEDGEVCEDSDLGGESCESQNTAGTGLSCSADCLSFDISTCTVLSYCGDGIKNGADVCDGSDAGIKTCGDYGLVGDVLGCNDTCTDFDTSTCGAASYCGDTNTDTPNSQGDIEECDPPVSATECIYGIASCQLCDANCQLQDRTGPYCGDRVKNGTEECDDGVDGSGVPASGDGCDADCKNEADPLEMACVGTTAEQENVVDNIDEIIGYRNASRNSYYRSSDQSCWVLGGLDNAATGAAGESCETACNNLDGSATGVGIDCAVGEWNDIGEVACNAITSGEPQVDALDDFAPYYYTQYNRCYERHSDVNTACNSIPDDGKQRICKCE